MGTYRLRKFFTDTVLYVGPPLYRDIGNSSLLDETICYIMNTDARGRFSFHVK